MYPDELYQLAFAFRKAKLWKSLCESELFAVALPDGEIGYCRVMGSGGERPALALYVGNKGLDSFRLQQEAGGAEKQSLKAYEAMLSRDCLQCSFTCKDMLTPDERTAVRAYASKHRLTLRGADAFPRFMSCRPVSEPWPITDGKEIRFLCAALEAAMEVGERVKGGDQILSWFRTKPAYDRSVPLLAKSGGGFGWSLHPLPPKLPVRYPEPFLSDELLMARLKKAKKRGGIWACDVILALRPEQANDTPRLKYPYTLLAADDETGQVFPTKVIPDLESGSEALLRALADRMLEHGIPREIMVTDERTYALLKDLAAALKIALTFQEENDLLDELEADYLEVKTQPAGTLEEEVAGLNERLLALDDDAFLAMPDELWDHLCSLEQEGLLTEIAAYRLRALSKRRK